MSHLFNNIFISLYWEIKFVLFNNFLNLSHSITKLLLLGNILWNFWKVSKNWINSFFLWNKNIFSKVSSFILSNKFKLSILEMIFKCSFNSSKLEKELEIISIILLSLILFLTIILQNWK